MLLLTIFIAVFSPAFFAHAYQTEPVQLDPNRQDFVVGPGKTDIVLNPGESRVLEIIVSNRTGKDRQFEINLKDFVGSNDLATPVVLTAETGVSTMRDYVTVPEKVFFLKNAERARIPVTVSVPKGAEPGGRYVSILISTLTQLEKTAKDSGMTQGGVPLITQTGTLVFITVPGDIKTEGRLSDFYTQNKKRIFSYGRDVAFDLVFENTGKIHLNPYGTIAVRNMFGQEVKKLELEPWFAMPQALRFREVDLVVDLKKDDNFMLGRYTAEATIFRGYGDEFDSKALVFWVLPWKLLLIILVALIMILWLIRYAIKYISTHFERRPEPPSESNSSAQTQGPNNNINVK